MKKIYLVVSYNPSSDDTSTYHFLDKKAATDKYSEILEDFENRYDFYETDYNYSSFRGYINNYYATASVKLIEIDINI